MYARELGATPVQTGLIYSVGAFVTAVASLAGGYLAHRHELKRLIIWGNALILPAGVMYVLASDWRWLLAAETLIGASFVIAPAIYYFTHLRTKRGAHGKSFGVMSVAFPLGMAFMPVVGGTIADRFGLRAPFVGCLAFYALSVAVLFALDEQRPEPITARSRAARLRAFLTERRFLGILALFGVLIFLEGVYTPFLPLRLKALEGFDYAAVGLVGSIMFAVNAVATPFAGHAADVYGVRRTLGFTLVVFGVALAGLAFTTGYLGVLSLAVLAGMSRHIYLMNSVATSKSVKRLPVGVGYGIMGFTRSALYTLGPSVGGVLAKSSNHLAVLVPGAAYAVFGAAILASAFVSGKGSGTR